MYQLKRLLVALDLTEMDDVLIKYTSFFAKKVKAEKVYFFHIAHDFKLPQELKTKYPDLLAPADESLEVIINDLITENWDSEYACERSVELKEGSPIDQLLKWVDNKDIDLVVMGRKQSLKGKGIVPQKFTNLAHASVLLVPEHTKFKLEKVIVPIDFSGHSKLAVDQALRLSETTNAKVSFVNVYTVPTGYHKTGKSYEDFAEIMQKHANNDYVEFLKESELKEKLDCAFVLDDDHSPSDKIFYYAEEQKADLIIMGSKGRTGIASILLGSVTTKVISYDTSIPLLVVKNKEENMGFLKALLNI
jgi:nucleotide-binding universal stress UspA family protein